jgi:shikimate dehydrogenase
VIARVPPTRLVLLGHPVSHSLSPRFQNAALAACGLRQRYSTLDVLPDALAATVRALSVEGAGGNVTIPHKEAMFVLADYRSEAAVQTGAVNVFWFENGALIGHNTDVEGLESALLALLPGGIAGATCALLGAGGSAGAALVALQRLGCGPIRVWSRTAGRASSLARRTGSYVTEYASAEATVQDASLVINATPIGLYGDAMPVDPMALAPDAAVLDLVYRRGGSAWMRACERRGHHAQDGLHMLVEQGAAAFTAWFGVEAPRQAMWAALEDMR